MEPRENSIGSDVTDSRSTPPRGRRIEALDVTTALPSPFGQAAATDTMGTIAAPLLAGFAFAAIGLVLQVQEHLRWPDQALVLLVCTLLLFITSVQATFNARRHYVPLDEWIEWLNLAATGRRRAELQRLYIDGLKDYAWWSQIARRSYNLAIVALLGSTAVLLVPDGGLGPWRAAAVGVAALGSVGEIAWSAKGEFKRRKHLKTIRYESSSDLAPLRMPGIRQQNPEPQGQELEPGAESTASARVMSRRLD
jgi:hypothetical protein